MKVTFLGTGTSRGVPVIGCRCPVCTSGDERNKRLRSSALLESESGARVVIDTSSDFRQQMLRAGIRRLDAAFYTHAHVDHILGLDDVFPFNIWSRKAFPIYAEAPTMEQIRITFRHLFEKDRYPGVPTIEPHVVEGPVEIGDLSLEPIRAYHGKLPVLGYRVGDFAWLTDVNRIPPESMEKLRGLRYLALDGLRYKPHFTHFTLDEAAQVARDLEVPQTYLIHMCHDVEHKEGCDFLPDGVDLAYDGLELQLDA